MHPAAATGSAREAPRRGAAQPTREVILDTAERLFAARGVDGIAVRALAREMGITASSLYNHFSGKEALYAAVLERGLRPIVELVIEAWQDPGLRPGRMNTTLDRLTAHLAHHPHLARLLQRALLEDTGTAQELIARWVSSLYREGLNVLRREARRAGWETAEVPHLGVALFGMIFAYFTDAGALRRLAGWDGDPFSERALAIQRRFLERALCRLLATARATARARAAARRTRTAEEQGWLTAAGSPTRASRGCASASARGSPVGGRGGRR